MYVNKIMNVNEVLKKHLISKMMKVREDTVVYYLYMNAKKKTHTNHYLLHGLLQKHTEIHKKYST